MSDNNSVSVFIENFNNGVYDAADVDTQIKAGWFDWFCKDSSLAKRLEVLGRKVVQLSKSNRIDNDRYYVFFKNNAPMSGGTYDSFSFCDMEHGDVKFWVGKPSYSNKWEVFGSQNDFNEALVEGSWADVKKYFL